MVSVLIKTRISLTRAAGWLGLQSGTAVAKRSLTSLISTDTERKQVHKVILKLHQCRHEEGDNQIHAQKVADV